MTAGTCLIDCRKPIWIHLTRRRSRKSNRPSISYNAFRASEGPNIASTWETNVFEPRYSATVIVLSSAHLDTLRHSISARALECRVIAEFDRRLAAKEISERHHTSMRETMRKFAGKYGDTQISHLTYLMVAHAAEAG